IAFGEGLTSEVLRAKAPLLLNREADFPNVSGSHLGVEAKAYLGVPIMAGDAAIGVISVQSTTQEGRFGEADARLLSTIAAIVGDIIQRRTPELINETGIDPRAVRMPGTPDRSGEIERMMVVPLISRDRVTGVTAVWRHAGEPFVQADLNFLVGLARQASIAIENARLFRAAQD